jgi:hypothetical protein
MQLEYKIDRTYDNLLVSQYTKDSFLNPKIMFDYIEKNLNIDIEDMSEYKDIVENVIINKGTYKLNDDDKKYYINNFSKLLNINSISLINNIANINTAKTISKELYLKDKEEFFRNNYTTSCSKSIEYLNLYNKILKLLE